MGDFQTIQKYEEWIGLFIILTILIAGIAIGMTLKGCM